MSDFKSTVEQADLIAKHFAIRYYKTVDSHDVPAIEALYAPDARIAWNGTPLQSGPALQQFWSAMPDIVTEVQTLDAHPLPRSNPNAPLIVTMSVTGRQAAYDAASREPLLNKPAVPLNSTKGKTKLTKDEIEQLPRTFHQSFVLTASKDAQGQLLVNAEGQPIYVARSDAFRYVA